MEHAAALTVPPPGHSVVSVPLIPSMHLCYKANLQFRFASALHGLLCSQQGESCPGTAVPQAPSTVTGDKTQCGVLTLTL